MFLSKLVATLLGVAVVSASSIMRRDDTTTVLLDIAAITNAVVDVQEGAAGFNGTRDQFNILTTGILTLNQSLLQTTADLKNGVFSPNNSLSIFSALNLLLIPYANALNDIAEKASIAVSAGFGNALLEDARSLETSNDLLFVAFEPIIQFDHLAEIVQFNLFLDQTFIHVVVTFSEALGVPAG